MKLLQPMLQKPYRWLQVLALASLLGLYLPCHAEVDEDDRGADFSQGQLDQILAPIALYPDTILSQVLIAATYPLEAVQADRWASTHPDSKGADAVARVEGKDWDPSVKALVAFPDILRRMSDDIDWTQKLGDAFLADEGRVMDSIQNLRKKAYASGSLNKVQHLKVQREDDEIIIEPAEERVVYVPVYDTRVVYGNWWWADYPPVYWHQPASYVQVSGFYWGPSIFIGPTIFYSSFGWHERHVVVVDRYEGRRPAFYTGRSIVNYQGAREWHHEPIHRRGVAYYNDDMRDHYGSRHESYRDARVYREEHRQLQDSPTRIQPGYRTNEMRPQELDRSEQVREHINHRYDHDTTQQPNNLGATRPTLTAPDRNRINPIQENSQSHARDYNMRQNNGGNIRPIQPERADPKPEREKQPPKDKSDDEDKRPNRFNRVM